MIKQLLNSVIAEYCHLSVSRIALAIMQAFKVILLFFSLFLTLWPEKRVERLRHDVAFRPPGDGDCFYASTVETLQIETQGLKKTEEGF